MNRYIYMGMTDEMEKMSFFWNKKTEPKMESPQVSLLRQELGLPEDSPDLLERALEMAAKKKREFDELKKKTQSMGVQTDEPVLN